MELLAEFAEYIKTTKPSQSVQHFFEKILNLTFIIIIIIIISLKEPALMIQTVISGLQIYFDRALGTNLLYRFERAQYAQVRHDYWTGPKVIVGTEKEMCLIYGAEHFLRMLGMCFILVYPGIFFWLTAVLFFIFSEFTADDSTFIT